MRIFQPRSVAVRVLTVPLGQSPRVCGGVSAAGLRCAQLHAWRGRLVILEATVESGVCVNFLIGSKIAANTCSVIHIRS